MTVLENPKFKRMYHKGDLMFVSLEDAKKHVANSWPLIIRKHPPIYFPVRKVYFELFSSEKLPRNKECMELPDLIKSYSFGSYAGAFITEIDQRFNIIPPGIKIICLDKKTNLYYSRAVSHHRIPAFEKMPNGNYRYYLKSWNESLQPDEWFPLFKIC